MRLGLYCERHWNAYERLIGDTIHASANDWIRAMEWMPLVGLVDRVEKETGNADRDADQG